jgi:Protein of unknown function (DUF3987)
MKNFDNIFGDEPEATEPPQYDGNTTDHATEPAKTNQGFKILSKGAEREMVVVGYVPDDIAQSITNGEISQEMMSRLHQHLDACSQRNEVMETIHVTDANIAMMESLGDFLNKVFPMVANLEDPLLEPFPIDVFPEPYREMITETARVINVPVAAPAVTMLGVLSTAVSWTLQVVSGPDQFASGVLQIIAIMKSSTGKSETVRMLFAPVNAIVKQSLQTWKTHSLSKLKARQRILEIAKEGIEKELRRSQSSIADNGNEEKLANIEEELREVEGNLFRHS